MTILGRTNRIRISSIILHDKEIWNVASKMERGKKEGKICSMVGIARSSTRTRVEWDARMEEEGRTRDKLERERTHPCQCHGWKAVPRELRFLARVPTTLTREDPRCRESAHPHSVADEENDAPRHAARRWRAPSRRRRANTPFDRACRTLVPCHPLCEHKFFFSSVLATSIHPIPILRWNKIFIYRKIRSEGEV